MVTSSSLTNLDTLSSYSITFNMVVCALPHVCGEYTAVTNVFRSNLELTAS